jgi:tetratricopeptide (TPR) repeat protein
VSGLSEYERLLRVITTPELRHGLLLARYEHAVLARQTWERAVADAGEMGRRIVVVDFSEADDEIDMLARFAEAAAEADVLFAVGLERMLVERGIEPRRTKAITTLNFNRDLLEARVGKPIVLWLSYRGARAFALEAPDTFDVIQTTFEFPETVVGTSPRLTHDTLPDGLHSAPPEEIPRLEQRAQILESLYADTSPGAEAADLAASLARIEFALGHDADAHEWSERAAEAFEMCGDLEGAAMQHLRRAERYFYQGQTDAAVGELDLAGALSERAGSVGGQLATLHLRSDVLVQSDDLEGALELIDGPTLKLCEDSSNILERAYTMGRRADIVALQGNLDEAYRIRSEEVLPVYARMGDMRSLAIATGKLANILQARGEFDDALQMLWAQIPILEDLGDVRGRAWTLSGIASILLIRGEFDEALRLRRELLGFYEKQADVRALVVAQISLAATLWERHHLVEDGAEIGALLRAAYETAERLGLSETKLIGTLRELWQPIFEGSEASATSALI